MNNLIQLDIACAFNAIEEAVEELGKYWSTETEHYYVTFNRTDIVEAEERLETALRCLDEYFRPEHLRKVVNGEGH